MRLAFVSVGVFVFGVLLFSVSGMALTGSLDGFSGTAAAGALLALVAFGVAAYLSAMKLKLGRRRLPDKAGSNEGVGSNASATPSTRQAVEENSEWS
ncbi:MAG: hypothetical protein HQ518_26265 [Rhodopirellula sp.]|nr:hypothetical protein [Rhodopirellula sp.]